MSIEDIPVAIGATAQLDEPSIDVVPEHAVPSVIDDFIADTNDEPVNDFVKDTISKDVGTSATRDIVMPSVAILFFMMKLKHKKIFDNFLFLCKKCVRFLTCTVKHFQHWIIYPVSDWLPLKNQ